MDPVYPTPLNGFVTTTQRSKKGVIKSNKVLVAITNYVTYNKGWAKQEYILQLLFCCFCEK